MGTKLYKHTQRMNSDTTPLPNLCSNTECNLFPRYTCSRCKSAKYCSKECQKLHFPNHKSACNSTVKWLGNNENNKFVMRKIKVNDNDYKNIVDTIARGEDYYLHIGVAVKPLHIIKRIDGNYYDKESGSRIISESEFLNNSEGLSIQRFTNFDDLTNKFGQPEDTIDQYCLFIDRPRKRLIILNASTDEILSDKVVLTLRDGIKMKLIKDNNSLFVREII